MDGRGLLTFLSILGGFLLCDIDLDRELDLSYGSDDVVGDKKEYAESGGEDDQVSHDDFIHSRTVEDGGNDVKR